ncbi:hypothetical protein LTR50_005181 [Elasticomyces elasticus]|nr:hypothetical protein LTR50_005181 [Elasticomyces elasticus]
MENFTLRSLLEYRRALPAVLAALTVAIYISVVMHFSPSKDPLFASLPFAGTLAHAAGTSSVDLNWHPPAVSSINDLAKVINGTGVNGFVFNSSVLPAGVPYGTYNWCNMPHVRPQEYLQVDESYVLEYVEVIHRHHKRTPYAANTFPKESYPWNCDDEGLFFYGKPLPKGSQPVDTYWSVYTSASNPFAPEGFNGTCRFPQITRGGLDDSFQHGKDLFDVYHDMLHFLPSTYNPEVVSFRVTNNIITSQVASMVIAGMFPEHAGQDVPLLIQPASIDSLEPAYTCTAASELTNAYGPGSNSTAWLAHLDASAPLHASLDSISGVDPSASTWHTTWDHYFDNLSARLCHAKPLPCNSDGNTTTTTAADPSFCITMAQAEQVFRLGEYEYSFLYRDAPASLRTSVGGYGVWIAELAQNLRHAIDPAAPSSTGDAGGRGVRYRHNVAHDGSVARLLSILQVDEMVWPGMGSEVVFELFSREKRFYVRALWGGRVLRSSNPSLGSVDLLPAETLLAYFDGLVGRGARKVPELCRASERL